MTKAKGEVVCGQMFASRGARKEMRNFPMALKRL